MKILKEYNYVRALKEFCDKKKINLEFKINSVDHKE